VDGTSTNLVWATVSVSGSSVYYINLAYIPNTTVASIFPGIVTTNLPASFTVSLTNTTSPTVANALTITNSNVTTAANFYKLFPHFILITNAVGGASPTLTSWTAGPQWNSFYPAANYLSNTGTSTLTLKTQYASGNAASGAVLTNSTFAASGNTTSVVLVRISLIFDSTIL